MQKRHEIDRDVYWPEVNEIALFYGIKIVHFENFLLYALVLQFFNREKKKDKKAIFYFILVIVWNFLKRTFQQRQSLFAVNVYSVFSDVWHNKQFKPHIIFPNNETFTMARLSLPAWLTHLHCDERYIVFWFSMGCALLLFVISMAQERSEWEKWWILSVNRVINKLYQIYLIRSQTSNSVAFELNSQFSSEGTKYQLYLKIDTEYQQREGTTTHKKWNMKFVFAAAIIILSPSVFTPHYFRIAQSVFAPLAFFFCEWKNIQAWKNQAPSVTLCKNKMQKLFFHLFRRFESSKNHTHSTE